MLALIFPLPESMICLISTFFSGLIIVFIILSCIVFEVLTNFSTFYPFVCVYVFILSFDLLRISHVERSRNISMLRTGLSFILRSFDYANAPLRMTQCLAASDTINQAHVHLTGIVCFKMFHNTWD